MIEKYTQNNNTPNTKNQIYIKSLLDSSSNQIQIEQVQKLKTFINIIQKQKQLLQIYSQTKASWFNYQNINHNNQYNNIKITLNGQSTNNTNHNQNTIHLQHQQQQYQSTNQKTKKQSQLINKNQKLSYQYYQTLKGQKIKIIHPHYIDYLLVQNNNFITIDYIPQSYFEHYQSHNQFLQLWIDRTVQLQSLLGNFVCKQRFGQFQYVKGPLSYAMENGITIIFNNFEEISNQLLTALRVLSNQLVIRQNQRIIQAKGAFKIIGIMDCNNSIEKGKKKKVNKSILQIKKIIPHATMPSLSYKNILPVQKITNQQNLQFFQMVFKQNQRVLGLTGLRKLLKRILRIRANMLEIQKSSISNQQRNQMNKKQSQYIFSKEEQNKIWNSYLTQSFKNELSLDIKDLSQNNYQATTYLQSIATSNKKQFQKMEIEQNQSSKYIQFKEQYRKITIGRVQIPIIISLNQNNRVQSHNIHMPKVVKTQYSLSVLQRVALCNQLGQSPLLISQTGCGKTTLVQYLAALSSHQLYVYNMSSGSDVMDLVGGFKPIDCKILIKDLLNKFQFMFKKVVNTDNQKFFDGLNKLFKQQNWNRLLDSIINAIKEVIKKFLRQDQQELMEWEALQKRFNNLKKNIDRIDSNLVFSFIEGNLLKALKNGDWVLVDQINLATNDILQKIVPLVQNKSIFLYQKGDLTVIQRHKNFRVFGCMNPANDSGKKPLPPNLMQKFTVIVLPQPSPQDINMMIRQICPSLQINLVETISDIYFKVKAEKVVSLRNLSRALMYINRNKDIYGFKRAVYDGLMLGFSHKQFLKELQCQNQPKNYSKQYKLVHNFLMQKGTFVSQKQQVFHLTETFLEHLKDLLRAIAGTQLPVLLQGPTSAGKTSMIRYVAYLSGNKCIRINNHEHTQIQQYLGNYFPDKSGKLVFREGPLVQAVRQGYWLILDQLNLARTQILQCLNRLLDDNRQLFLPQQQKHIKPHKSFRIFATQNPSSYSGRKILSRAFRNRFVSISFSDLKIQDIVSILTIRVPLIAQSQQLKKYIQKVLKPLMNYRQRQKLFSKDGMITIRDLLKWTSREFISKQDFIKQGYAILGQRLRNQQEKEFVEKVLLGRDGIQKIKTDDKLNDKSSINMDPQYEKIVQQEILSKSQLLQKSKIYVQFNKSFKRMAALTIKAIKNNQSVLLVGQTGCGKTTLAQLLAELSQRKFYSINCHKHMEASDLLGSLRPVIKQNLKITEQTEQIISEQKVASNKNNMFQFVDGVVLSAMKNGGILLIDQINTAQDSVLQRLNEVLQSATIGVERGQGWQVITAKTGFSIIATMNPSGDYGKKQLSPALRNRFTEIWVQPITHPSAIQNAFNDITDMIKKKLSFGVKKIKQFLNKKSNQIIEENQCMQESKSGDQNFLVQYEAQIEKLPNLIYEFIKKYNSQIAPKYELQRKLLTMRDIGWICHFVTSISFKFNYQNQSQIKLNMPLKRYILALKILSIQGIRYTFSDQSQQGTITTDRLQNITNDIKNLINSQSQNIENQINTQSKQDQSIQLLKDLQRMSFPVLIKTSLPLDLLGIEPKNMVFFSPHTDLSDLLGQYKPISGNKFQWQDKQLLKSVKQGGNVALFDLNLAQQPVIEGVNSLFDHRRSIFVVELNHTFQAGQQFKPIVILRDLHGNNSGKNSGRKGLPNSVLNRFVKLWIPNVSVNRKIQHLKQKYQTNNTVSNEKANYVFYEKLKQYISENPKITFQILDLICQFKQSNNLQMIEEILGIQIFSTKVLTQKSDKLSLISSNLNQLKVFTQSINEEKILQLLPLINQQNLKSKNQIKQLISVYCLMNNTNFSPCIYGNQQQRENFINALGYLLQANYKNIQDLSQKLQVGQGKPIKKILLSTMTDMNDLLGSYQQVTTAKYQKENNFNQNQFVYMESNLVKAIKQGFWLIYVEVPNQMLLQRLEKGIKQIYMQKVQIVVGIDSSNMLLSNSNNGLISNTKFVPISLLNENEQEKSKNKSKINLNKLQSFLFKPNFTSFKKFDRQFRYNETLEWIHQQISKTESKQLIEGYQRIVKQILNINKRESASNSSLNLNDLEIKIATMRNSQLKKISNDFIQINEKLLKIDKNQEMIDQIDQSLLEKYLLLEKINKMYLCINKILNKDQVQNENKQEHNMISNIILSSVNPFLSKNTITCKNSLYPTNQREYKHRLLIKILFTVKQSLLSRMISHLGNKKYSSSKQNSLLNNQEYFKNISKKFQIMYLSNWDNFANNANKILQIIWKAYDQELLIKFFNQIQRLFDKAKQTAVLQSFVKFNDDQFVKVTTVKIINQNINQNIAIQQKSNFEINTKAVSQKQANNKLLIQERNQKFTDIYSNYESDFSQCQKMKILLFKDINTITKRLQKQQMQKILQSYINDLDIDMKEIGNWMRKSKLKNYRQFLSFWKILNKQQHKYSKINAQKFDNFLLKIKNNLQTKSAMDIQSQNKLNSPLQIIKNFIPSQELIPLHIQNHLKNQIDLKTIRTYIGKQKSYYQCYQKLCNIKYSSYKPKNFLELQTTINRLVFQEKKLQKTIRYRGGNYKSGSGNQIDQNYFALKDFYNVLLRFSNELRSSNFKDISLIEKIIIQLYENYFDKFGDILIGYLCALTLIHYQLFNKIQSKQKFSQKNKYHSILFQMVSLYQLPNQIEFLLEKVTQKQQEDIVDNAKLYSQVQKQFNNQVIVDQYTEEGKQKRKQLDEQQFNELFGKNKQKQLIKFFAKNKQQRQRQQLVTQSKNVLEKLYFILSPFQNAFKFKRLFIVQKLNQCSHNDFTKAIILLNLLTQSTSQPSLKLDLQLTHVSEKLNIYEHSDPQLSYNLIKPLPFILFKINQILQQYPTHPVSSLGTLCNKIYQHNVFETQVYKVLTDCQFLVQKIYETNSTLPAKMHIPVEEIVRECLNLRRIELKNWKNMLGLKIRRREQSDILEFVRLWRLLKQVLGQQQTIEVRQSRHQKKNKNKIKSKRTIQTKSGQCFILVEKYLRQGPISCYSLRMRLVKYLSNNLTFHFPDIKKDRDINIIKSTIGRVMGFYFYLYPKIEERYTEIAQKKVAEMKDYQKLAGWDSNQFLIFKASCQKFQRKIHHILKSYEQELSITVGSLHKEFQNNEIKNSISQFNTMIVFKYKKQSDQNFQQMDVEKNNENQQIQDQQKENQLDEESEIIQVNNQNLERLYKSLIDKLFEAISQIKQEHHKTQSRLLLIRSYLGDIQEKLQESYQHLSKSSEEQQSQNKIVDYKQKFLQKWMFNDSTSYFKAIKYYYGLWDKMCQRLAGSWQKQLVERIWNNVQKIWLKVSNLIPKPKNLKNQGSLNDNQLIQCLEALVSNNHKKEKNEFNHQLFNQEITKVQKILEDQQKYQIQKSYFNDQNKDAPIGNKMIQLMKLGYIVATIACNLQKNGLCARDPQQGQCQQNSQVGDGVGIGQGQIHQGAQDKGQQIEYQQQVQGYKGQQQHQNNDNNKQQDNGINMQGQFQGEMYDKQKKQNGNQQQQQEQSDHGSNNEQMGQVDNQKREEDIKNDKKDQKDNIQNDADVDINGGQGQSQLVDNQKPQKQQRKAQNNRQDKIQDQKEQQDQQGQSNERSDWDDNNPGQKINKQEKQQIGDDQDAQMESQDNQDIEQSQSIQDSKNQKNNQNQQIKLQKDHDQQMDIQQQEQISQENDQKDKLVGQNDSQIQNQQQPEKQQQDKKKKTKSKKTNIQAYGRKNIPNSMKNPLKKNQLPNQNQQDQNQQYPGMQNQEQDNNQNNQENIDNSSKLAEHNFMNNKSSLDKDFLKELLEKARNLEQYQNKNDIDIMQDLNVTVNDQQKQQINPNNEKNQQYELTQKDQNIKMTNLPSFLDDMQKQMEKQKQLKNIEQQQKQKQKGQRNQQQKQQIQQKNQKQQKDLQKNKNKQTSKKQKQSKKLQQSKNQQLKYEEINKKKLQEKIKEEYQQKIKNLNIKEKHQQKEFYEQLYKKIVTDNKLQKIDIIIQQQDQYHSKIISEAQKISHILEEQLKTVLQPQQTSEYSGDYRTGKKLNLRKIIPYIASNYRKDKIWLRRTEPSQADYHIMLILDDTKSMHYGNVMTQALKGMLSISIALQRLGSIDFAIGAIRDNLYIRKKFKQSLIPEKIVKQYDFLYEAQNSHDLSLPASLQSSIKKFSQNIQGGSVQTKNLCFIISDGKMNKQLVRPYLRQAQRKDITFVFIIIDSAKESIINIKSFSKDENSGKMKMKNYMDDFPFEYFLIVKNVQELGQVLATSLLQFIMQK